MSQDGDFEFYIREMMTSETETSAIWTVSSLADRTVSVG
jgi:hypothetical protein